MKPCNAYIRSGPTIISYRLRVYNGLSNSGFTCNTVNRVYNFVDRVLQNMYSENVGQSNDHRRPQTHYNFVGSAIIWLHLCGEVDLTTGIHLRISSNTAEFWPLI